MRAALAFLGRRVTALLALSAALGVLLFGAELALAHGLSGFAAALGLAPAAPPAPAALPEGSGSALDVLRPGALFDPARPALGALLLAAIAALRGLLAGAGAYAQGAAAERFKRDQRGRVVRWAFSGGPVSAARAAVLFHEQISQASFAVAQGQAALLELTVALCLLPGLVYLAPGLTLAVLPLLAIPLLPLRLLRARLGRRSRELLDEWTRAAGRLTVGIKNLLLLRVHGTAARERELAERSLDACRDHALGYHRLAAAEIAYSQSLAIAIVCVVGLVARSRAALPPAALVAYFYLLYRFLQQLARLGYSATSMALGMPHLRGLMAFEAEAAARIHPPAPRPAPAAPAPAGPIGWSLRGVSFAFEGAPTPVIRDLTLEVPPGSALVITGPSGAGKTTLLSLLAGEIAPTAGTIDVRYPGQEGPLAGGRASLLSAFGYVGPESFLVEGSLRDNLVYGLGRDPDAAEMDRALRAAGCDYIDSLPGGLEHRLDDQGGGLSAGQKQRLCLARALLRAPRALLLDEATASLDLRAEEAVVEALRALKGEVTLVIATHRAALLSLADQRVDLEDRGPLPRREATLSSRSRAGPCDA